MISLLIPVFGEPVCQHCQAPPAVVQPGTVVQGPWIVPEKRSSLFSKETSFEDHFGKKVSLNRPGMPMVVSFIYTRCENERKCPRMTAHLAALGKQLSASNLKGRAGVILMTYDPKFDQAKVLAEYGKKRKFLTAETDGTCRLVRCQNDDYQKLFEKWKLTVNFDRRDKVNIHGNQILLIDNEGRLARRYEILLPSHQDLIKDLQMLTAELPPKLKD